MSTPPQYRYPASTAATERQFEYEDCPCRGCDYRVPCRQRLSSLSGARSEDGYGQRPRNHAERIDTIKENSTVMTATQRKHLDDLKEELDSARAKPIRPPARLKKRR